MLRTRKKDPGNAGTEPITEALVIEQIHKRGSSFDAYRIYDKIEGFYRRTDYLSFRGDPQRCKAVYDILDDLARRKMVLRMPNTPRVQHFLEDVPPVLFDLAPYQRKALTQRLVELEGDK